MIIRWEGGKFGEYAEAERGRFEVWFLRGNTAIAYTDGDEVRIITENYRKSDREAVLEFAEQYDCEVVWKN